VGFLLTSIDRLKPWDIDQWGAIKLGLHICALDFSVANPPRQALQLSAAIYSRLCTLLSAVVRSLGGKMAVSVQPRRRRFPARGRSAYQAVPQPPGTA
jgi:hypothetical protein